MYLIDTDIMVYALNGNPRVVQRFEAYSAQPKVISVVTYGELLYGAMKSARKQENIAKVRRVTELFPVIEVSRAIIETFASLRAEMDLQGRRVDALDLIIGSTALTLGCRLVTNNERHFTPIPGLAFENWAKP